MADILIRGMVMPPKGKSICIEIFGAGGVHKFGECYPCALAYEVKTPHGRLIDADELVSKYTEEINKLEEWAKIHEKEERLDMFRACHLRAAYLAEAKLNIEAAPTIVPAEGGTDNG